VTDPVDERAGDSELRRNPVSGKWTVLVPKRGERPTDVGDSRPACPFCPGNEALTPPEIDAFRDPPAAADAPGWQVRVVPNKYAAFSGGHEVIVHSPSHDAQLEELTLDQVTAVVRMYQRRVDAHLQAGARAVTVIANRGGAAGSSLAHPHSQVFATPVLPSLLHDELEQFARYRNRFGACPVCETIADADEAPANLVFEGPVVAWTPPASRFGYEVWLAPAEHEADFRRADAPAVAGALRRALAAIARVTAGAPLNYWLHTAPNDLTGPFHWHIEIAPRLTTLAGFELGTDIAIAIVDPEQAARELRAALDG
jgi:UDPglucose--hexose-1-phosphate uridylyltransferase